MRRLAVIAVLAALLVPSPAMAYVGPGTSLGVVGVVFGIISSLFLALLSLLWYPFKRLIRRFRKPAEESAQQAGTDSA